MGTTRKFGNLDGAGRLQVAMSTSLGDYLLTKDNLPDIFDEVTNATATQAYNATDNCQEMTVTTTGDYAIFQSKQIHPYYTGKPQQPEFTYINLEPETNVVKRVGYFSSATTGSYDTAFDGTYLESGSGVVKLCVANAGTVTSTTITSTAMDWTKFNVSLIDFLYLGGTSAKLLQVFDDKLNEMARHDHANHQTGTIFNDPAQPIRAEIRSTGGAGSFKFVCANVGSSGNLGNGHGMKANIDTGTGSISIATANQPYALLAIRKTNSHIDYHSTNVDILSLAGASEGFRWRLLINPTVSDAFTWTTISNRYMEYWSRATGVATFTTTGGIEIDSGTGESRGSTFHELSKALRIGTSIAGVQDILVLEITLMTTTQDITAVLGGVVI